MFAPSSLVNLAFAAFNVAVESHAVIALRLSGFAAGTAAPGEAVRMHGEKLAAWFEAQQAATAAAFSGHPENAASAVVSVYRRHTRANVARLSRR